jgi:hypothetical protein
VLTDPELATGFLELHRSLETLTRRPEQDEKLAEWLHALIERHTAHRPTRPPLAGRDDRALRLALEYLAERPERNVDELAVAAGIGKFRLVRLFRERTGLPLHALQIAHRGKWVVNGREATKSLPPARRKRPAWWGTLYIAAARPTRDCG